MKSVGLLQWIDDRINPIVVKELRQAVQSRFVAWVILLFLTLQLLFVGIHLFVVAAEGRTESLEYQGGRDVFTALQVILLSTCMLFLPIYTGVRLAAERNELNTDLLFITTLKPRAIIGNFVSAVVLALLIFSACAPFMLFTFFLRGVDLPSIVFILSIDFLVVIGSVQLMVFLAVVDTNRALKILLGLLGLNWLIGIFSMTLSGTMALMWSGITPLLEEENFWLGVASVVLGIVGLCGLLFTWSVALLSPPSSNRAWPVRLYLFLFWLVSGVAVAYIAYKVRVEIPFAIWLAVMSIVWGLQLVISVNERQHWSPRVRAAIPRSWLLRLPAFFLFSGSAGGVLFGCTMMGLTALAFYAFQFCSEAYAWFPTHVYRRDQMTNMFETFAVAFAYVLCYGLTAVFVRDRLFPRLPPGYTWLVMLVLVGAASLLPFVVSMLVSYRNWRYDTHYIWMLANPAVAITEFAETRNYYNRQQVFLIFLAIWGGGAALVNIPWFFRQVRGFRPLPVEEQGPSAQRPLVAVLVTE